MSVVQCCRRHSGIFTCMSELVKVIPPRYIAIGCNSTYLHYNNKASCIIHIIGGNNMVVVCVRPAVELCLIIEQSSTSIDKWYYSLPLAL